MTRTKALVAVLTLWLASVLLYGWYDISRTMASLATNPLPDLYANDLDLQVLAFVLTKGLASVLVLGVALVVVASVRRQPDRSVRSNLTSAGQD
ncbi:MAG: hypothetical protein ACK520_09790 [Inhella sp.]|jgi:hypothetical protein|uniref:hypothetical protein n=1 Tax=Inhella sp. TaxID=1921806 RepID=UPI0022CA49C7|nr:hypothetical protein [Inhella sp.]MCZ8234635.1 hypothetical protein [Inhella sp.]